MPLIVTIDLVPEGDEFRSRELARLVIAREAAIRPHPAYSGGVGDYRLFVRHTSDRDRVVELEGGAVEVPRHANVVDFLLGILQRVDWDD